MRYASVCSGVEAASVAWEPLGWEPAWFSEIEPFPCAVLKERFPEVPNLGDMTKIKGDEHGNRTIDLLVGGTPCQDLSVAGKRMGFSGKRSVLALDFVRLAYESGAKWFVWENVPGVFSSNGGEDFAQLLSLFAGWQVDTPADRWGRFGIVEQSPGCFGLAWRVIDVQYARVDGFPRAIPQRRNRVFVVGYLGDWRRAAQVLFEPEGLLGNTPPRREAGKGTASGAGGGVADAVWDARGRGRGDVVPTLCGDHASRPTDYTPVIVEPYRMAGFGEYEHDGTDSTLKQRDYKDATDLVVVLNDQGGSSINVENEELSPTLRANSHQHEPIIAMATQQGGAEIAENLCPTITAAAGMSGNNQHVIALQANGKGWNNDGKAVCFQQNSRDEVRLMSGDGAPCVAVAFERRFVRTTGGQPAEGVNPCLRADTNSGDGAPCVAIAENIIGRKVENGGNGTGAQEELSYTLNTTGVHGVARGSIVRRLTPRECERLMGFPDDWTRIPWRGKPAEECPDGPRYKACGNSMGVNVMRWIGRRIQSVESQN